MEISRSAGPSAISSSSMTPDPCSKSLQAEQSVLSAHAPSHPQCLLALSDDKTRFGLQHFFVCPGNIGDILLLRSSSYHSYYSQRLYTVTHLSHPGRCRGCQQTLSCRGTRPRGQPQWAAHTRHCPRRAHTQPAMSRIHQELSHPLHLSYNNLSCDSLIELLTISLIQSPRQNKCLYSIQFPVLDSFLPYSQSPRKSPASWERSHLYTKSCNVVLMFCLKMILP